MIVFDYSTIYLLAHRNGLYLHVDVEGLGLGLQGLYSATNCVVTIMNKQQNKQMLLTTHIYTYIM